VNSATEVDADVNTAIAAAAEAAYDACLAAATAARRPSPLDLPQVGYTYMYTFCDVFICFYVFVCSRHSGLCVICATADEADAYMFYRCFFLFFFGSPHLRDNRSRERLNGFS